MFVLQKTEIETDLMSSGHRVAYRDEQLNLLQPD